MKQFPKNNKFNLFLLPIIISFAVEFTCCKKAILVVLPEVSTDGSKNITEVTAVIMGTIISNGGDENTRQGFIFDELPSDLGSNVGTIEIECGKDSKGTFSGGAVNLFAGSNYSYKAYAKNSVGTSYGAALTFKTLGGPVYGPTVTDYDGNVYKTITIGNQTFTKENFHGTHYANGDPIPNVTDTTIWANLRTGAYCYYNNDPKIGEVYGGLYNFYVGADPRGLIVGWHVPSNHEWGV